MINLLLPTRNNPQKAREFIQNTIGNAVDQNNVRIIVGIDDDDDNTFAADLEYLPNVMTVVGPRQPTLGGLIDILHLAADDFSSPTDIVGWAADDVAFAPYWDEQTNLAFANRPSGIYHPFMDVENTTRVTDFTYFPFMTISFARNLRQIQGFVCTDLFPSWFHDTWMDEIADLIGFKRMMYWKVIQSTKQSDNSGPPELRFWCDLFEATRPERIATATKLLGRAPSQAVIDAVEQKRRHHRDPEFATRWQGSTIDARYLAAARRAKRHWSQLVDEWTPIPHPEPGPLLAHA